MNGKSQLFNLLNKSSPTASNNSEVASNNQQDSIQQVKIQANKLDLEVTKLLDESKLGEAQNLFKKTSIELIHDPKAREHKDYIENYLNFIRKKIVNLIIQNSKDEFLLECDNISVGIIPEEHMNVLIQDRLDSLENQFKELNYLYSKQEINQIFETPKRKRNLQCLSNCESCNSNCYKALNHKFGHSCKKCHENPQNSKKNMQFTQNDEKYEPKQIGMETKLISIKNQVQSFINLDSVEFNHCLLVKNQHLTAIALNYYEGLSIHSLLIILNETSCEVIELNSKIFKTRLPIMDILSINICGNEIYCIPKNSKEGSMTIFKTSNLFNWELVEFPFYRDCVITSPLLFSEGRIAHVCTGYKNKASKNYVMALNQVDFGKLVSQPQSEVYWNENFQVKAICSSHSNEIFLLCQDLEEYFLCNRNGHLKTRFNVKNTSLSTFDEETCEIVFLQDTNLICFDLNGIETLNIQLKVEGNYGNAIGLHKSGNHLTVLFSNLTVVTFTL